MFTTSLQLVSVNIQYTVYSRAAQKFLLISLRPSKRFLTSSKIILDAKQQTNRYKEFSQ
jgi:hypothetical protein